MKFFWVCGLIPLSNKFSGFLYIVILVTSTTGLIPGVLLIRWAPRTRMFLNRSNLSKCLLICIITKVCIPFQANHYGFPVREHKDADTLDYYKPVLDKHGIDRQTFGNVSEILFINPISLKIYMTRLWMNLTGVLWMPK
jgi:hypothetical protein